MLTYKKMVSGKNILGMQTGLGENIIESKANLVCINFQLAFFSVMPSKTVKQPRC